MCVFESWLFPLTHQQGGGTTKKTELSGAKTMNGHFNNPNFGTKGGKPKKMYEKLCRTQSTKRRQRRKCKQIHIMPNNICIHKILHYYTFSSRMKKKHWINNILYSLSVLFFARNNFAIANIAAFVFAFVCFCSRQWIFGIEITCWCSIKTWASRIALFLLCVTTKLCTHITHTALTLIITDLLSKSLLLSWDMYHTYAPSKVMEPNRKQQPTRSTEMGGGLEKARRKEHVIFINNQKVLQSYVLWHEPATITSGYLLMRVYCTCVWVCMIFSYRFSLAFYVCPTVLLLLGDAN